MATCPTCGGAMLTERPHRHPKPPMSETPLRRYIIRQRYRGWRVAEVWAHTAAEARALADAGKDQGIDRDIDWVGKAQARLAGGGPPR